jgi:hypothetical protein
LIPGEQSHDPVSKNKMQTQELGVWLTFLVSLSSMHEALSSIPRIEKKKKNKGKEKNV